MKNYFVDLLQTQTASLLNGPISKSMTVTSKSKARGSTPKLDRSKIRLVVYADHDKGRTPMFDSSAIRKADEPVQTGPSRKTTRARFVPNFINPKVPLPSDQGSPPQKNAPKYQFQKLGSDVKVLEEMMFGSVAMAYKGSTFKVHFIRYPPQLMLSKVFFPEKPKRESADLDSDTSSLQSQSGDFSTSRHASHHQERPPFAQSIPMAVPSPHDEFVESTDDDSGLASLTSSGSFQTPFPSPSSSSTSSYNSLHRRWMRTQTTSLQKKKWSSQEHLPSQENSIPKKKKSKLALGILFGHDENDEESERLFENFFFSHVTLFEGHIQKLQAVIERAFFNRRNFIPMVMEALETFRDDVYDLYMAPRLSEPVWLNMMSFSSYRYHFCEKFMNEFMFLAGKYDNKNTKFFVSTLVSAVITHHLAWVPTVTPAGGTPSKTYLDKHSAKWLDTLAKTHPYNPLWAQLGDLYGAIGFPLKLARTVVVGKKQDIVKKFLYVLSYFIRCSDVQESSDSGCLDSFMNDLHLEESPSESEKLGLDVTPVNEDHNSNNSLASLQDGMDKSLTSMSSCENMNSFEILRRERSLTENWEIEMADKTFHSIGGSVEMMDIKLSSEQTKCQKGENFCNEIVENSLSVADSESVGQCSLSMAQVLESSRVENVQHVRRSSSMISSGGSIHSNDIIVNAMKDGVTQDSGKSSGSKVISMLSQQLQSEKSEPKLKTSDVRKIFIKEGSNSMFEEYFQDGIETKTIDDIAEHERVVKHRLAVSGLDGQTDMENGDGRDVVPELPPQQKISMSRQNSVDKANISRPNSLAPGRCRSVTPTELGRRRHLSSTSSFDIEQFDPLVHCRELTMPDLNNESTQWSIKAFDRNFGRSLLAGYSDHYMSDFVLHGTSDTNFLPKLLSDLQMASQHSVLDEPIAEAVCVIADTDNWSVEVASSRLLEKSPKGTSGWMTSQLVCNLVESVLDLWKLKMSPEFCLMHLEDRLQEIFFKSKMLSEYLKGVKKTNMKELTSMLGFDASDLPLLAAIAGTHSPSLAVGV